MSDDSMTPDSIWEHDLFDRRKEAELLIGYLESIAARPNLREDKRTPPVAAALSVGCSRRIARAWMR